ncbi:unnamed protein product [Rotaria sp. Silwood2]|nr:unnamed protein product [Rotaria sp. Silwood2]CAF4236804.1 unnamed protein product [Rotaria sp. Silwood2]CAF4354587.1 unnamed protein product [Rotaria sp. Silwood2]CAF4643263.1 unnamed protein product [Rotaria sp. Silwood2]
MNLLNIAEHLLYLADTEYTSENSATIADEIFAAERLFEILKSFKDSYFNDLYSYDTLEFEDEFDEMTDEEDGDEIDDYNENEYSDLKSTFTLEEMEKIIEWVDQHPNHCSFQQEYVSPRTLSFTGERTTEVAVKKKYNTTHSYTIQPVTLANGHLLEKF